MFNLLYKYAFILGHIPELSQVEIIRILEQYKVEYNTIFSNSQVLVVSTQNELDTAKLQDRLGGTIKIVDINIKVTQEDLLEDVAKLVMRRYQKLKAKGKKFQFGFSVYGDSHLRELKNIGLSIKKDLSAKKIRARFVVSKAVNLSSVIVKKEKLIDQGADVVIIEADHEYYLGHTVSIQDFQSFSARDYGRPTRDDESGMLPPKLARMMLNLSQTDFEQTILDPFCGSGTVIQEALLLGYKNIIGSDLTDKAVKFTKNNIKWLKTKYKIDIAGVNTYQLDSRDLLDVIKKESVDAIVTEPYLGPSRNRGQDSNNNQIANVVSELSELYLKSFKEFYKVLKVDGKVVIILPIINGQLMDILKEIGQLGFEIEMLSEEPRGSIVYARPGQRVMREIFVFTKTQKHGKH